jgi:DNA-binding NarL/FixJ family response regulator
MSTKSRIKVLIVDDHPFLRAGVAASIQEEEMTVVAEASNGYEAIDLFREHSPDITLMDLQLPELSGVETIISIRAENPRARIIVLTTFEGDILARRALIAGAEGYILKNMVPKELVEAIRKVHAGKKYIPKEIATKLAEHYQDQDLSVREIEVLKAVSDGKSTRTIASKLSIAEETVKAHVKNILHKLGAYDRTDAVSIATTRGFFI